MAQLHSVQPPQSFSYQEKFDHTAQIYQCCCQCMHVKTGTIIIAVVECIIAISRISMQFGMTAGALTTMQVCEIVLTVIWLAIIGCLLYGLYLDNADYLMPYLIVQVIVVTMMFVGALIAFILLVSGGSSLSILIGEEAAKNVQGHFDCEKRSQVLGALLVIYLLIGELLVWFFVVVLACYRYLRDKQRAIAKVYGQQPAVPMQYYQAPVGQQQYGAMPMR